MAILERRWGCPGCGATHGVVAERRAVEEVPVAFVGVGASWSEALDAEEPAYAREDACYRCRACRAVFAEPVPLARSWYA